MARKTVKLGKTPAPKAAPKKAAPKPAARPVPKAAAPRPAPKPAGPPRPPQAAPQRGGLGLGLGMNAQQRGNYQAAAQAGQGSQFLGSHPGLANRINQVDPRSQQASRIQQFNSGGVPQGGMAPQPMPQPRPAQMPGASFQAPPPMPQPRPAQMPSANFQAPQSQPMGPSPWSSQQSLGGMQGMTQGPQSLPPGYGQSPWQGQVNQGMNQVLQSRMGAPKQQGPTQQQTMNDPSYRMPQGGF